MDFSAALKALRDGHAVGRMVDEQTIFTMYLVPAGGILAEHLAVPGDMPIDAIGAEHILASDWEVVTKVEEVANEQQQSEVQAQEAPEGQTSAGPEAEAEG